MNWLTVLIDDEQATECAVDVAKFVETEELKLSDIVEKADALNCENWLQLQTKVDEYLIAEMYKSCADLVENADFTEVNNYYYVETELKQYDSDIETIEQAYEQIMFLRLKSK